MISGVALFLTSEMKLGLRELKKLRVSQLVMVTETKSRYTNPKSHALSFIQPHGDYEAGMAFLSL